MESVLVHLCDGDLEAASLLFTHRETEEMLCFPFGCPLAIKQLIVLVDFDDGTSGVVAAPPEELELFANFISIIWAGGIEGDFEGEFAFVEVMNLNLVQGFDREPVDVVALEADTISSSWKFLFDYRNCSQFIFAQ